MISVLINKVYNFWLNINALLPLYFGRKVFSVFLFISLFVNNSYSQEISFGTYYSFDITLTDSSIIKLQPIIERADTGETSK